MGIKDDDIVKELNGAEKEKEMLNFRTSLAKNQFIDEIKNGLGEEIKANGNQVKIIKPTIWQRIGRTIKKIFTGI